MALIQFHPGVLATLSARMRRILHPLQILRPLARDDMQGMHLAESPLISTPPLLRASQRPSML